MGKTLLRKFIDERVRDYLEPQRRGTPKGEQIGLSREKFIASLYFLYNLKQKDIAKKVNISYGLLRKWRTEENFNGAIESHVSDFTVYALSHFLKTGKKTYLQEMQVFNLPLNEIGGYKISAESILPEFVDCNLYSPSVKAKFVAVLKKLKTEAEKKAESLRKAIVGNRIPIELIDIESNLSAIRTASIFFYYMWTLEESEIKELLVRERKETGKEILRDIQKILLKDVVTEDNKKTVMYGLCLLERLLNIEA